MTILMLSLTFELNVYHVSCMNGNDKMICLIVLAYHSHWSLMSQMDNLLVVHCSITVSDSAYF